MILSVFYQWQKSFIGSLFPAYLSYKALKSRDQRECVRLMMYWIVFSLFSFVEGILDLIFGFWMPFYNGTKIIFMFWIISGNGAKVLYENLVIKQLEQHEKIIDQYLKYLKDIFIGIAFNAAKFLWTYVNQQLFILISKVQTSALENMQGNRQGGYWRQLLLTESMAIANNGSDGAPPVIETIDTTDMEEISSAKEQPVKKTKRKRKVLIQDVSKDLNSRRPMTRAAAAAFQNGFSDTDCNDFD